MEEEKSLQRFTDLSNMNVEEVSSLMVAHLSQFPESRRQLMDLVVYQINRELNENFCKSSFSENEVPRLNQYKFDKLVEVYKLVFGKKKYNHIKRQVYTNNQLRISDAIQNSVLFHNRIPSVNDIALETGLSRTTVHKHLKDINLRGFKETNQVAVKVLLEKALAKLYKIGMEENNINALKAFIRFQQDKKPNHQTNYIQVNNLKITQEQISGLPEDKAKDLIQILLTKNKEDKISGY